MDLISLINKNKNKVFNIVVIIISIVIALNIYKKQMVGIDSLKAKISEEDKKNRTLDNIGELETKIDAYRRLLVKKEANSSINDINNIARNAGIRIISIRPSGEDSFIDYKKSMFDLTVSSPDYDSLARFINALEVYKSVYMIEVLDIHPYSDIKRNELNANLRISAVAISE
jgi:Tfp pilus assembly protein PilO